VGGAVAVPAPGTPPAAWAAGVLTGVATGRAADAGPVSNDGIAAAAEAGG